MKSFKNYISQIQNFKQDLLITFEEFSSDYNEAITASPSIGKKFLSSAAFERFLKTKMSALNSDPETNKNVKAMLVAMANRILSIDQFLKQPSKQEVKRQKVAKAMENFKLKKSTI